MEDKTLFEQYNIEVYRQTHLYDMWILSNEEWAKSHISSGKLDYDMLMEKGGIAANEEDDAANSKHFFDKFFDENPDINICYGDEDELDCNGIRKNPWFKPDFSYDTFLSYDYFGGAVSIREEFAKKMGLTGLSDNELREYLLQSVTPDSKIGHIDRILYHKPFEQEKAEEPKYRYETYSLSENSCVSVIIPSKDNPDMLEKCIMAVKGAVSMPYEIIVIDNGSNDDNRNRIDSLTKHLDFIYSYEKEDFNFSKMCNKGASMASGNLLLFLNDDVLVRGTDTIKTMASQALCSHTGAVGVKLYYPGGSMIQHAGITNMSVGPAHKLGRMDDDEGRISYYHGRNKAVYNMIAVTAAAMMIEKRKFDEAGRFDERFAVAYNDVEFCFRLFEKEYLNVVRNDISFIHYESLSRGEDTSPEKAKRLKSERELLYRLHPLFKNYDPFYSRHLVQFRLDADYNPEYTFSHENMELMSRVKEIGFIKDNSMNFTDKLLRKGKKAMLCIDRKYEYCKADGKEATFIEGWTSLTREDNYKYNRYLVLKSEKKCYQIEIFDKYRNDTDAAVPNSEYNLLNGFTAKIEANKLLSGEYNVAIAFVNKKNKKMITLITDNVISII